MTLVETIVATALTAALSGIVLSLATAAETLARNQPEAADLQQRARLALQALGADLRAAGAGLDRGSLAGPLVRYFPPVTPSADGGITIWTVTSRAAQAAPLMAIAQGATLVALRDADSCPPGQPACAFAPGTSALAFTSSGCRTTMRIGAVSETTLQLSSPLGGCELDPASAVAQGEVRTYRVDPSTRQLVRRDETTGSSAPVLDGVASFAVEYFADAAGTEPIAGVTDADLVRVRRIRVTLRFTAISPLARVADLTVAVDVTPPNLGGS